MCKLLHSGNPDALDIDPLACSQCGFVASKKSALSNHLRLHGIVKSSFADRKPIQRRLRPTNATKLHVLEQLRDYYAEEGQHHSRTEFINWCGYPKQTVSLWLKSTKLMMVVNLPECRAKMRLRNVVTADRSFFPAQQDQLFEKFLYRRRARGQEVDYEWLKTQMEVILKRDKPKGFQDFKYSNGWVSSFVNRYDISCQVQTEKKPFSNALRNPVLQAFHTETCIIQQSEGLNPRDPVYGRFSPKCIWNIDQIPASLADAKRHSLNPRGEACWITNHGPSGIYKRVVTVILTLRADGEQIVPPFLLFRGKGKLSPAVLAELDAQGIPYAFQQKAWADGQTCIEHLQFFAKILKEKCPEYKEHMLYLDGLAAQATDRYIDLALDLNILPVYFPPNCMHLLQPVDHRVAAWFKRTWHGLYLVEEEDCYEKWQDFHNNGAMNTQYQRITMLKWTSILWQHLKEMPDFLTRAFTSTGCLITLKGEHSIRFPNIEDYVFKYPRIKHAS
jgi:hypothetical protein